LRALADGIEDVSREVRVESLQGIINLGPPGAPADQQALKALLEKRIKNDKDKLASIWLRVALMRIDGASVNDANFNYIADQMKATDPPGIAADAARALGVCGPAASKQVGPLIDALKSSDVTLVAWAAWALGRIGSDAKGAVPALEQLKESSDPSIKQAVEAAIKEINTVRKAS
jgi:HEAT repeat protein